MEYALYWRPVSTGSAVYSTVGEWINAKRLRVEGVSVAVRTSFALPLVVLALLSPAVEAQEQTPGQATAQAPPIPQSPAPLIFNITVVGNTPLQGSDLPISRIPAPVQTATSRDVDRAGALDVSDVLNRRLNGVHVNEIRATRFSPM